MHISVGAGVKTGNRLIHVNEPTHFQAMKIIHHATERGNQILELPMQEIIWRHNSLQGGKDIAWIEV